MDIAKVTSKGQVTIPKSVRDDLDLQPGSKLLFVKSGDSWRVFSSDQPRKGQMNQSLEMETHERDRVLRELAAKYDVESTELTKEPENIEVVMDSLQNAFANVAKVNSWESEQDIVDYIRALRNGDTE